MIGDRIKTARQISRLSLRDLADLVGVSHTAISKYERGLDVPSSRVLLNLSEALDVQLDYFLRPVSVEVVEPAFRKCLSISKKEQNRILGLVQDWAERYIDAERLVYADSPPSSWSSDAFPIVVDTIEDAERAASEVRGMWKLGLDPVESLIEVLEDHGAIVGTFETDDKFDACTFMVGERPVIAARNIDCGDRQNFSLAHELGHLITTSDETLSEKIADRFAGAFIAPREVVFMELGSKREHINIGELELLKHKYKLSMQAWLRRAKDLEIISNQCYQRYCKLFSARGWRKEEPGSQVESEYPVRLKMLVFHAYSERRISETRAAELLGISLKQFLSESGEDYAGTEKALCS